MPNENDFESALAKYPELIEDGLRLIGRQLVVYGRRMDLVFTDRFQRKLITELKWGPIKDVHIGQIMNYEGILLSGDDPSIRVMLIGTRVPPNLRRTLDHHGIAWKEITQAELVSFLTCKQDHELMKVFDGTSTSLIDADRARRITLPKTNQIADKPILPSAPSGTAEYGDCLLEKIAKCKNPAAKEFFEVAQLRKQPRTKEGFRYYDARPTVRWYVKPEIEKAYVIQKGRFRGDVEFWQSLLSVPASVRPKRIADGEADIRFDLVTAADFEAFEQIVQRESEAISLSWEDSRRKRQR